MLLTILLLGLLLIDISKKIGTYDISILPFEDCCTVFVPKHPVINPSIKTCEIEESKFNYLKLIDKCIDNINTIKISEDNYSELL